MTWLQHVRVVVPNGSTELAVQYYNVVFGLPEVSSPPGTTPGDGVWLRLYGRQLIQISEADAPSADASLAVMVGDFDATLERIHAIHAPWVDEDDVFGGRRGLTRDPAGNRIEVLEFPVIASGVAG
jgi:catechol 2,3-dioxygenase-like lactoylglutathione lyase family enzyme